jgi:hypothetical protein
MLPIARQYKIPLNGKKTLLFGIDVSNEHSASKFGVENHNFSFHGNPFHWYKTPKHRSVKIFQKTKNHLKILDARIVRYVQGPEKYYVKHIRFSDLGGIRARICAPLA